MAQPRDGDHTPTLRYAIPDEGSMSRSRLPNRQPLGPYTYDDYAQTPDEERYQLIQGFLVRDPSPFYSHQALAIELSALSRNWAVKNGEVTIFAAPFDVVFDDYNVLQPDLLMIRTAKHKRLTRRGLEAPPDLVVEILSPSSRRRDTDEKLDLYAHFGVGEYWIVDPSERNIKRFVRDDQNDELRSEGEYTGGELRSAVFPTFSIDARNLFAVLDRFR